jgi:hypothetical protein
MSSTRQKLGVVLQAGQHFVRQPAMNHYDGFD